MTSDAALVAQTLRDRFPGAVQTGPSARALHSADESAFVAAPADAVFVPETVDALCEAVALCQQNSVPVITVGARSGQEGGIVPTQGGLALSTEGLNTIHDVDTAAMDCWVEAGVTRLALDAALRHTGLFFPVDPGADATLGGMAATGASGTMSLRYGSMVENTLGLEVVTADGQRITTGTRARKSSAGYHLTKLFVASEGTLGVITKLRLRLHPLPEARATVSARFARVEDAMECAAQAALVGLPLARAELMDATLMRGVARLTGTPDDRVHWLGFELHGGEEQVRNASATLTELCTETGGVNVKRATLPEDIAAIWAMRHGAVEAEKALRPGAAAIVTDIAVPLNAVAGLITDANAELEKQNLLAPLCGHLGDGNLHYVLLVAPADVGERDRANHFKTWLAERALTLGGTISGEHGIGLGKRHLMEAAHGPALDVMRAIKGTLDPKGILNPGKVLP